MKKIIATTLLSAIASAFLGGVPKQVQAAITINTTETRYEPDGVRFFFTVQDWSHTFGEVNPCMKFRPNETICRVSIVANKQPGIYDAVGSYYRTWELPVRTGGSASLQLLLYDLLNQGSFYVPLDGSILVPMRDANNENCITFSYTKVGVEKGLFGPCTRVVAPPLKCEIKGNPTINHKNLPDNALDGAMASTNLTLECKGPSSVTVSTSKTNEWGVRLRADNSLYSRITVNDMDVTAGVDFPVNAGVATPLVIRSTLVTRGTVEPGPFSGSTVITVSPP